jgi:preprotein translocase subunit SecF
MLKKILRFYEKDCKKLMLIPLVMIAFFSGVIIYHKVVTGEFFSKDISLKGGTSITYYSSNRLTGVQEWLTNSWGDDTQLIIINDPLGGFKGYEFRVGQELSVDEVKDKLSLLLGREVLITEFSMGFQGASIAENFFHESLIIIMVSFVFMSLVVLYYFRSIIPAISITFSTIADVVVVIGMLNLLGEPMSVAGIGALLMLIGLSTDSDMLLAANIIKNKEEGLMDRLKKGFKTELTMTLAAITTALVMYFLTSIDMIRSIALILLIGSLSDLINTWVLSAGLQRIFMEKKRR